MIGIEHISELVNDSIANVEKHHADLISSGRILFVEGDGRKGYASEAPYKAIHVGAAAPKIPPAVRIFLLKLFISLLHPYLLHFFLTSSLAVFDGARIVLLFIFK